MSYKRREIPVVITAALAILVIFEYFFKWQDATNVSVRAQGWAVILASFAIGIGVVSTTIFHIRNVMGRVKKQWYLSAWLVFLMFATIIIGVGLGPDSSSYKWMYNTTINPLNATISTLLTFFGFSAAYRSFRARNIDATLLLVTAVIIILYVVPLGELITPSWSFVGNWLTSYPNAVVGRVLYATVVMGSIALGVRIILGYERGYLAGD